MDLDIMELTESSMDALRLDDPFLYYSIFSPTAYPLIGLPSFIFIWCSGDLLVLYTAAMLG